MPVNFRKAKDRKARCISCGADYDHSVDLVEFRMGNITGVVCDLCLKELFDKSLKMMSIIDGETKDRRQMRVKNERNAARSQKGGPGRSINEALKGVADEG